MDINAGVWWKFDSYEIKPLRYKGGELPSGYIVPGRNAKLKKYDPWHEWNRNFLPRQDASTPYSELLSMPAMWEEGKIFVQLTEKGERAILDWCAEYGVLGVFPYRVIEIRLPPKHMVPEFEWVPPDTPVQIVFTKVATGWRKRNQYQLPGARPGAVGVLLDDDPGGDNPPAFRPLDEALRFFPTLKDPSDIPLPLSDEFWACYAEPVADFFTAVRTLSDASAAARAKSLPRAEVDQIRLGVGLRTLESLLAHQRMGVNWKPRVGFGTRWVSDSLLATIAAMIAEDVRAAGRPLKCRVCGKIFMSSRPQAAYCSKRCRWRHGQREHRRNSIGES